MWEVKIIHSPSQDLRWRHVFSYKALQALLNYRNQFESCEM